MTLIVDGALNKITAPNGFTFDGTVTGTAALPAIKLANFVDVMAITATVATGTVNFYVSSGAGQYFTANASANWTLNVAFSAGTSLDAAMAVGDSIAIEHMVTQGATAYYNTVFKIDTVTITPKWALGLAPIAGNINSIDSYIYTIVKTAAATFTVFATQVQYK